MFCYHGKTTTITQYNWLKDVGIKKITKGENDVIVRACRDIIHFCENDIIPKLSNDTQGTFYSFNNTIFLLSLYIPFYSLPPLFIVSNNIIKGNWTIDVIYHFDSHKTELVEVNSFGCELAAGSGIFLIFSIHFFYYC